MAGGTLLVIDLLARDWRATAVRQVFPAGSDNDILRLHLGRCRRRPDTKILRRTVGRFRSRQRGQQAKRYSSRPSKHGH
jgi:hypothetical protein